MYIELPSLTISTEGIYEIRIRQPYEDLHKGTDSLPDPLWYRPEKEYNEKLEKKDSLQNNQALVAALLGIFLDER